MAQRVESNVWIFGDSFVEQRVGWVEILLADRPAIFRSVSGASISHTLEQLLAETTNIKETDSVIVSYTSPFRNYFKGMHFKHNMILTADPKDNAAYKNYIAHLWDERTELLDFFGKISLIHNVLIPSLKTKRCVETIGFDLIDIAKGATVNLKDDSAIKSITNTIPTLMSRPALFEIINKFWGAKNKAEQEAMLTKEEFFLSANHIGLNKNDASHAILTAYAEHFKILRL
jgi:hypothetical protein